MIEVLVYSREDCHLCEQAIEDLKSLQAEVPHKLLVIDVDGNQDLQKAYGFEVPVVEVGPYRLKAPFTRQELQLTLSAAADRERHIDALANAPSSYPAANTWTRADGFSYWLARHYLAFFNLFLFLYAGLPFLAPVLMASGAQAPAAVIYKGYSMVCHQLSYRSFFLFGEQAVYPRAAAGVPGVLSFQQATGLSEDNTPEALAADRQFTGTPLIGYKVAICERDVAIYAAMLLFGLLYAAAGRHLPPLPWYLWVLVGLVPIGLDGFSQLLSQPPFNFFAFRESTPLLRVLTGGLFGFSTAWFGYAYVEETMADSRRILADKWARIQRRSAMDGNASGQAA